MLTKVDFSTVLPVNGFVQYLRALEQLKKKGLNLSVIICGISGKIFGFLDFLSGFLCPDFGILHT